MNPFLACIGAGLVGGITIGLVIGHAKLMEYRWYFIVPIAMYDVATWVVIEQPQPLIFTVLVVMIGAITALIAWRRTRPHRRIKVGDCVE